MKNRGPKGRGSLLTPDDLEVGKHVTVHSLKRSLQNSPLFGRAMQISAINFPFLVVKAVRDGEIITLDVRLVNLMRVTGEFVKAQETPTKDV